MKEMHGVWNAKTPGGRLIEVAVLDGDGKVFIRIGDNLNAEMTLNQAKFFARQIGAAVKRSTKK